MLDPNLTYFVSHSPLLNITAPVEDPSNATELTPDPAGDYFLAVIVLLCTSLGCPANCATLLFFVHQRKDLPTVLYMLISAVDLVTCLTVFPTGFSLAMNRDPGLFGNEIFCQVHFTLDGYYPNESCTA